MMFEFKSLNGGLESQTGFSMEDMNRQLERMDASFLRFSETMADHPYPARRVMAMKAFTESELFAEWRPDLISTDRLLVPHEEVERRCREILDFVRM